MEDLYTYMFWGNYDQRMEELASIAQEEQWTSEGRNPNNILKNYMKFTFWKLKSENKIIENENYCLFNTGLFTPYYEPIYVYGEKNTGDEPDWKFKGFLTEYELGNYGIGIYPERADYFSDPSLLVFDWHCKINVQYKHILQDAENRSRLPETVVNSPVALEVLKGVIDTAIKKVMANYKLAVPQYFGNKIQLLIPLYFTQENKPDLALVLTKVNSEFYQGHTCLTMDMAYNNARLIAKPESNWLVP